MLTVHHLRISQSERIVWLCEELAVPYELKLYDRGADGMAPPEYKALHPFGTAPVITDGPLVLGESGAIIEYIAHVHGSGALFVGPEDPAYADFLFWFHFANASFMAAFMMDMVAQRLGTEPITSRSDTAFAMVEQRLGEATWFAGDQFTAADIMMHFPLSRARVFSGRTLDNAPNTRDYLERISERPAYRRCISRCERD